MTTAQTHNLSVDDNPVGNRCGAKAKRTGLPCQRFAMANGRCMMHGGKTPRGLALPQTTHGGRSKHLPTRLAARYQEALDDPALLSQRENIATLEARLCDAMDSASNLESGQLWGDLHAAMRDYDKAAASAAKDATERQQEALRAIRYLIGEGYNERQTWIEIRQIMQEQRALRDSEQKRLIDMQQMITATQANLLLGAVAHIIKQNVTDKGALANISRELGQLVNVPER